MIARIRKSLDEKEKGFTLIELLVVIIIIGILSAIAIPLFLNQRKKAEDAAAKADVSTIGKEIATYFVDNSTGPATVTQAGSQYLIGTDVIGRSSTNVALTAVVSTGWTYDSWCVGVKNPSGKVAVTGYKYSASGGLQAGVC